MDNNIIFSKDNEAKETLLLVQSLQKRFVDKLNKISYDFGEEKEFCKILWLRDNGIHGGGIRYEAKDETIFNSASVNISQVHYDDLETKKLQSATAISTIIHPKNPNIPSIHIHTSLTKLKDNKSYWRIMADLNPSNENNEDKEEFLTSLKNLTNDNLQVGLEQGNKYFYIPELNRHRGICHFYLENYKTSNKESDFNFAKKFTQGIIDTYINIFTKELKTKKETKENEQRNQLNYHTLYLFQVLTLDRGTTAGLLIHNQNDLGIMGSLPNKINKELLFSWIEKMQTPKNELVKNIYSCINKEGIIDISTKEKLANVVRNFYKQYPETLSLQASADTIPTTISNHKDS